MNDRVRITLAVLLVAVGLLCMVYAFVIWRQVTSGVPPVPVTTPPPESHFDSPEETDADGVNAEETEPSESHKKDAAAALAVASAHRPPSEGRTKKMPDEAREKALTLWLVAALPMVFVVLIAILMVRRWARPKPMARTGPSDTTDLWVEAGKRLKIP